MPWRIPKQQEDPKPPDTQPEPKDVAARRRAMRRDDKLRREGRGGMVNLSPFERFGVWSSVSIRHEERQAIQRICGMAPSGLLRERSVVIAGLRLLSSMTVADAMIAALRETRPKGRQHFKVVRYVAGHHMRMCPARGGCELFECDKCGMFWVRGLPPTSSCLGLAARDNIDTKALFKAIYGESTLREFLERGLDNKLEMEKPNATNTDTTAVDIGRPEAEGDRGAGDPAPGAGAGDERLDDRGAGNAAQPTSDK
jgi:hypothetical protein